MTKEIKVKIEDVLKELLLKLEKNKIQMFDCYDIAGDYKITLFSDEKIDVLYAPGYEYVEIVGLNEKDFHYFFNKYGY